MYEETIAQLEPMAQPAADPLTILIVEDDETQIAPLEHRLTRQGYRVAAALSGAEARDAAAKCRPDLVLLDLRLPDQDGFELCTQLADHPSTCGVPIIVVSASGVARYSATGPLRRRLLLCAQALRPERAADADRTSSARRFTTGLVLSGLSVVARQNGISYPLAGVQERLKYWPFATATLAT